jgi:hypothetical protein
MLSSQELANFTVMSKKGTIKKLKEIKMNGFIDFYIQHFHILTKKD